MMTNGEHNDLYRSGMGSIPNIANQLKLQNAIEAMKLLHDDGCITDSYYHRNLMSIINNITKVFTEEEIKQGHSTTK